MSLFWCRFIKHLTPSTTVLYDVCDRFLQIMCSLRATIINILGWAQQCELPVDAKVPFPTHSFSRKWKIPGSSALCLEEINISPARKSTFPARFPPLLLQLPKRHQRKRDVRSKRVLLFKGGIGARAQPKSNYTLGCFDPVWPNSDHNNLFPF